MDLKLLTVKQFVTKSEPRMSHHLRFNEEFQISWNSFFDARAINSSFKGVWDKMLSYSIFPPKTISKASCIISGFSFCNTSLSRCVRILLDAFLSLSNQNFSLLSFYSHNISLIFSLPFFTCSWGLFAKYFSASTTTHWYIHSSTDV